jgi:hypothetical protein
MGNIKAVIDLINHMGNTNQKKGQSWTLEYIIGGIAWEEWTLKYTKGRIRCLGGVSILCRPVTPPVNLIPNEVNGTNSSSKLVSQGQQLVWDTLDKIWISNKLHHRHVMMEYCYMS